MRYYKAREHVQTKETVARNYICTGIQLAVENTARFVGGDAKVLVAWDEITHQKPKDTRTAEEIAADIIKGAGLKVGDDNEFIRSSGEIDTGHVGISSGAEESV